MCCPCQQGTSLRPASHLCSAATGEANLPSAGKASKAASDLGKKAVNSLPNAPDLSNPKGSKDSSFPTVGKATKPGNPLVVSLALAFPCIGCGACLMLCAGVTSPHGLLFVSECTALEVPPLCPWKPSNALCRTLLRSQSRLAPPTSSRMSSSS